MLANTYRRHLHERARDQYGYITTRDAAKLGIPPVELRKIAARGGLTHVGRGVFRFEDIPRTGLEPFMEAVLRVGDEAFLTADAVLAMHGLALANPRRIRVGTTRRVRAELPPAIEVLQQRIDPEDLTEYEGIPATTVAKAIHDARGVIMRDRLVEAAREAMQRGLMLRQEGNRVIGELEASA
ncbi:MAG: type IV toxin-antitoxin system AbiEi family antitoxin domain-containing protein [Chloroflexota bacterium]|nr:type IV toxin-antitoxin system AbiEi family antitoxin domain-containing protein [Chloroflexota bacterium]